MGADGCDRQSLAVAVSDGASVVKLITKFSKLVVDNLIVLRHIIRKLEDDVRCLMATKTTKISMTTSMAVPQHPHVYK